MDTGKKGYISILWLLFLFKSHVTSDEGQDIHNAFIKEMSEKHVKQETVPWNILITKLLPLASFLTKHQKAPPYRELAMFTGGNGVSDVAWQAVVVNEKMKNSSMGEMLQMTPEEVSEKINVQVELIEMYMKCLREEVKS